MSTWSLALSANTRHDTGYLATTADFIMPPPTLTLSFLPGDLAQIAIADPHRGANILSSSVLAELVDILDKLRERSDLAGLILISSKPGSFFAGADLRELAAKFDTPTERIFDYCQRGRRLFAQLGELPFPTLAAISGLALGGGAELALWCDYRILADNPQTAIGFPEVKIGLIPGWGGTFTAARLAGLGPAVEMICGGEPLPAAKAHKLGLADACVPSGELATAAREFLLLQHGGPAQLAKLRQQKFAPLAYDPVELTFLRHTAQAHIQSQTQGHYPAPLDALDVICQSVGLTREVACDLAGRRMAELVGTPVNRALVQLFFSTEQNKKDPGISRERAAELTPTPLEHVGVIGAGIMGLGIVAANLKNRVPTVLFDAQAQVLSAGARQALEEAAWNKELRRTSLERLAELQPLLQTATADGEFAQCQLVIEAIIENLEVKKQVLGRIEQSVAGNAILASNTSTIRIGQIAAGLTRPERFCGLHFFNPVRKMRLVEVICGPATSDATILAATAYAKRLGKIPIVVRDGPGFLVNRLLSPYLNEALALLHEGISHTAIDEASVAFGMPLGPFALYDLVGIDTSMYAGRTMYEAYRERYFLSPALVTLYKQGRLGVKSGAGFYQYGNGKERERPQFDPRLAELLGITPADNTISIEELQWRLFLPMVLEATRALEEKIVAHVGDVDLGMIFGLGFPAFRGGLLAWADSVGLPQILEKVQSYAALGVRWQPTPLLVEMAAGGKKFYGAESTESGKERKY
ncbi:MAG: 3-hydroxyacyl-CoA dehydrogenase NAD-binding domain-containing protein [Pirellulales bacterium]|nr:3-hydroxyacyl-CoA dehydrogenase NAD-binding domain-containing protein [Pirellulales bacterium]